MLMIGKISMSGVEVNIIMSSHADTPVPISAFSENRKIKKNRLIQERSSLD